MKDNVFRKYDIRGKVGTEFSIDTVYDVTRAIAYFFLEKNPDVRIVAVGMDGRNHSPQIKQQVCNALIDSGLDVVFIGVCPSPVLYFSLFNYPFDAGLMITASHNPKEYNGIKICLDKKMVWGEDVQKIKNLFKAGKHILGGQKGEYTEQYMIEPYIDWIKKHFNHLVGNDISAVVDCGNGAAGTVLPLLLKKMKLTQIQLLFEEVDGNYPHHEADPVVEENMQDVKKVLLNSHVQVGIGLDGDCDRMAAMTKKGELVSGDKMLAIFAKPVLEKNKGAAIVFDIKASEGLPEMIDTLGGKPCMAPSGHSIVKKHMYENDALLGGELSGHFFFADRYFGYDDGFYAMLRLFEIMVESGKNLQILVDEFPKKFSSEEIRIECSDDKKEFVVQEAKRLFAARPDVRLITIDGIRVVMDYGWGLLRVSNTQPVVSLRFESHSKEGLQKVRDDFFHIMKPYFDDSYLKEQINR